MPLFIAKTYTQSDNINWKVTQLEQSLNFKFENLKIEEIPVKSYQERLEEAHAHAKRMIMTVLYSWEVGQHAILVKYKKISELEKSCCTFCWEATQPSGQ